MRLGMAAFFLPAGLFAQRCPDVPVPTVASPAIPSDVCIPKGFTGIPLEYFDDYSWRLFISMVWPAETGHRGAADVKQTVGGPGPRLFETEKSLWEVFHDDGSAPAPFDKYDAASYNACKAKPESGDLILASSPPYAEIGQAGNGELNGPLLA